MKTTGQRILCYLSDNGATSIVELRSRLGVPLGALVDALNGMVIDGAIDSVLLPGGVAYQLTASMFLS